MTAGVRELSTARRNTYLRMLSEAQREISTSVCASKNVKTVNVRTERDRERARTSRNAKRRKAARITLTNLLQHADHRDKPDSQQQGKQRVTQMRPSAAAPGS